VIDHGPTDDDTMQEHSLKVGFLKACTETLVKLCGTARDELIGMLEKFGVLGIGREERGQIARVEGIELALDDVGGSAFMRWE